MNTMTHDNRLRIRTIEKWLHITVDDDRLYHTRRAAAQRKLAVEATDPAVVSAHHALADLHEARADDAPVSPRRRKLTLVHQA